MATLRAVSIDASQLVGVIEAWAAAGLPLIALEADAPARFGAGSMWVTRRRPEIDREACP